MNERKVAGNTAMLMALQIPLHRVHLCKSMVILYIYKNDLRKT